MAEQKPEVERAEEGVFKATIVGLESPEALAKLEELSFRIKSVKLTPSDLVAGDTYCGNSNC